MSCCGTSCSCGNGKKMPDSESVFLSGFSAGKELLIQHDRMKGLNNLRIRIEVIEVRFKNNRKGFFRDNRPLLLKKDDRVVVEVDGGYDTGTVSLTGDQAMKRYGNRGSHGSPGSLSHVLRKAEPADIDRWLEAKKRERSALIRSRQIADGLGLDLGIRDVEFRGDNRKATIYYTAEGPVDLRDLVRQYAAEFKVAVEMQRAGAGQYH